MLGMDWATSSCATVSDAGRWCMSLTAAPQTHWGTLMPSAWSSSCSTPTSCLNPRCLACFPGYLRHVTKIVYGSSMLKWQ